MTVHKLGYSWLRTSQITPFSLALFWKRVRMIKFPCKFLNLDSKQPVWKRPEVLKSTRGKRFGMTRRHVIYLFQREYDESGSKSWCNEKCVWWMYVKKPADNVVNKNKTVLVWVWGDTIFISQHKSLSSFILFISCSLSHPDFTLFTLQLLCRFSIKLTALSKLLECSRICLSVALADTGCFYMEPIIHQ